MAKKQPISSNIIPFPAGLRNADIDSSIKRCRHTLASLAPSAERRAYIAGYLDCLMEKIEKSDGTTVSACR